MQQALMTVRYQVSGNALRFRQEMEKAAQTIAHTPGMLGTISGLEAERGAGLSVYVFDSMMAARTFGVGPVIASLAGHADVTDVRVEIVPVDQASSAASGMSRMAA